MSTKESETKIAEHIAARGRMYEDARRKAEEAVSKMKGPTFFISDKPMSGEELSRVVAARMEERSRQYAEAARLAVSAHGSR